MFTLLVFFLGVAVGAVFHVVFIKWFVRAKNATKEIASDVQREYEKAKKN